MARASSRRAFEDLDVLALRLQPAALVDTARGAVFGDEKDQPLRHRAGAHEGLEDATGLGDMTARLLLRLATDGFLGAELIQQPGRHLDQRLGMAVDEGGVAELAHEKHRAARRVVEQDGRAIAAVIGLPIEGLPAAVPALVVQGRLLQEIPVVRQHAHLAHADPLRHRGGFTILVHRNP